jgi:hypothetical protein
VSTFVYIISHASLGGLAAPVKVGITKSLGSRLASLQTGNSRQIEVAFHFVLASRQDAVFAEAEFHREMAQFRLRGEWFDMEPLYALEVLTGIVFDILERQYAICVNRTLALRVSKASENLRTVTTKFWGLPE